VETGGDEDELCGDGCGWDELCGDGWGWDEVCGAVGDGDELCVDGCGWDELWGRVGMRMNSMGMGADGMYAMGTADGMNCVEMGMNSVGMGAIFCLQLHAAG